MKEVKENITETEWLRRLYIEDLSKIVRYGCVERSRVAHPAKWNKLETIVQLSEGVTEPMALPFNDPDRKIWVWSDQHFFHKNIISFSDRPFYSIEQMNEHLILNHNEYVGENDICIWGGDVGFGATGEINNLLERCNGYKILIVGNHDFNGKKRRKLAFDETHLVYSVDYPDVSMVFTHYPMFNVPWPWVNIHGHLHAFPNPVSDHDRHVNINCEVQEYRPKLLDEVAAQAHMRLLASQAP